jgi:hypothetical protein
MAKYQVEHQPVSSRSTTVREFEAHSDAAALQVAALLIAESYGAPDAHVQIDQEAGRVTIGAGFWSRRGSFRLQRLE